MNAIQAHARRARSILHAARIYLHNGDEHALDLRLTIADERDPFRRFSLELELLGHAIAVALKPALDAALKAATAIAEALENAKPRTR